MSSFLWSLARVGGVVLVATAAGWFATAALGLDGRTRRAERLGWSYALGCGLLIVFVPLSLVLCLRPGWPGFLALAVLLGVLARRFRLPAREAPIARPGNLSAPLRLLILLGVGLYALRALTEPMWANDFIAIWGLKGKTIFGAVGLPERFTQSTALEFSHPEYPLGVPLLYAAIAFLTGRWDDHALALVFPLFQVATLAVLGNWLRRRGASTNVALFAAAIVACAEPLYSGFLTGMAEVPLSFGLLLFGTALVDALEETDSVALRRLAFASALIAATKNEGLFLAAAGSAIAFAAGPKARRRVAPAALAAALFVRVLHVPWRSRLPLADFDRNLWSWARVWDALAAAGGLVSPAGWTGLALIAILVALGRSVPAGDRLLALIACGLAAYLFVPSLAVRGPAWLVETTLLRTTAALIPLAAVAIAIRFREPAGSV